MTSDLSRRQLIQLVVGGMSTAALVAAGCSGGETDRGSASASPTDDDRSGSGSGSVPEVDVGRVLALGEERLLADLLALGIRPVASTSNVAEAGFPGVEADTTGIEALPSTEPNLEHLASLSPDVVVAPTFVLDHVAEDSLRALGGELIIITSEDTRGTLREVAAAFDLVDRADELIADLDDAIATARESLDARQRAVSVATIYPGSVVAAWVDGPTPVPATLLELGFSLRPSLDDVGDAPIGRAYLSLEQLGLFDAPDLIALQSEIVDGEAEAFAEITRNPLWAGLDAVAAGRVVEIDRLGYAGLTGQRRLVDDLADQLG